MVKGLGSIVAGSLLKAGGETVVESGNRKREAALKILEKADAKELAKFQHGLGMEKQAAGDVAAAERLGTQLTSQEKQTAARIASQEKTSTAGITSREKLAADADKSALDRDRERNVANIALEGMRHDNAAKRAEGEFKLKKKLEEWKLKNVPKGQLTDKDKLGALTAMFATVDFDGNETLTDESKKNIASILSKAKSKELRELGDALSGVMFETPNAKHIDWLIMNPEKAAEFDKKFGANASKQYIGKR